MTTRIGRITPKPGSPVAAPVQQPNSGWTCAYRISTTSCGAVSGPTAEAAMRAAWGEVGERMGGRDG